MRFQVQSLWALQADGVLVCVVQSQRHLASLIQDLFYPLNSLIDLKVKVFIVLFKSFPAEVTVIIFAEDLCELHETLRLIVAWEYFV
jgi:hypothetical protein